MRSQVRSSLPILALLPLAAPLAAQGTGLPPLQIVTHDWPASETAGDFGRFFVSDVSGLPGREAVGLRGGRLYAAADPSAFNGVVRINDTLDGIVDLAIVPSGGPELHDSVLTVDPVNGLLEHRYDVDLGTFSSTVIDSGWTTVSRLAVGDLDGDGEVNDIVGADGSVALTLIHSSGAYTAGASTINAASIVDLEVLDYDADGHADIAMLTTTGLSVVEYGGPAFPFAPSPASTGILEVVPRGNAGGDDLVWCLPFGSTWLLFVQDAFGRGPAVPMQFQPTIGATAIDVDLVDLSTFDRDLDGLRDLVVSQRTIASAFTMMNTGSLTGASFTNVPTSVDRSDFSVTGSMAPNRGTAVAYANEGEQTWLFYPLDSDDEVMVAKLDGVAEEDGIAAAGLALDFFVDCDCETDHLEIVFSTPDPSPGAYNAVQIVAFHHCAATDPVEPQSVANVVSYFPSAGSRWRARIELPEGYCGTMNPEAIFELALLFVSASADQDGRPVLATSYRLETFASRYGEIDDVDDLQDLDPTATIEDITGESTACCPPAPVLGAVPGGVVVLDELPEFGAPPVIARPVFVPDLVLEQI